MSAVFKTLQLEHEHRADISGFVVVRLSASPTNRSVQALAYLDGDLVASGSAADNFAKDVISSPFQSFTVPVPKGSIVKIVSPAGGAGVEVRMFFA